MTTETDEDLAFEQGFNSINEKPTQPQAQETPEPAAAPADQEPATAPEAVAKPEEKPEPAVDPFAGLPPAVRELLATIPAMRTEIETTRRMANMVPALQSRIDKLSQPVPATAPEAVTPSKGRFAKVEAIRNELPEIADALDEIANAHLQGREQPHQAKPAAQTEVPPPAEKSPHEDALDSVRPTWSDELMSSDFQLWLTQQPADFQNMVARTNKAGDILTALKKFDGFKAQTTSTQQLNQTRTGRMAAAVVPQGDGRRQRVAATPEDEEEAAFAAGFKRARGRA